MNLEAWEREVIMSFYRQYLEDSYGRPALMKLDIDLRTVNPTSVYAVLLAQGLSGHRPLKTSTHDQGFVQPLKAHEHWHVDMSYLNICGTFYYLCSILDGYSRMIVHWAIRERMTEADVEPIVQRALEKYPGVHPCIISDHGPKFIARDFKKFIRVIELSLVRTSPYYRQSNGKIERWHRTLKADCIRPGTPLSIEDARHIVEHFVTHYNTAQLHNAIDDVTSWNKLCGREQALDAARDQKLESRGRPPPESADGHWPRYRARAVGWPGAAAGKPGRDGRHPSPPRSGTSHHPPSPRPSRASGPGPVGLRPASGDDNGVTCRSHILIRQPIAKWESPAQIHAGSRGSWHRRNVYPPEGTREQVKHRAALSATVITTGARSRMCGRCEAGRTCPRGQHKP